MALGLTDRSGAIAAPATSEPVAAANTARTVFLFQNISDTDMYINFGAVAVADSNSFRVAPGELWSFEQQTVVTQAVNVICASAAKKWVAKEG